MPSAGLRKMRQLFGRLLAAVPVFIGITFISFAVIHLAPGSPVEGRAELNPKMSAQAKEKLAELYGLDRPLAAQYVSWAMRIARLDFGSSFADGERVMVKIGRAVPVTLTVNLLALLCMLGAGIPLGVFSAMRRGSLLERALSMASFAAFAAPTFWLALVLMWLLGVQWRILPVAGLHAVFYEDLAPAEQILDAARHLVLPVAISALTGLAGVSRLMREGMLEALSQNYVRTARAKGLPEGRVVYGHALRNALLPAITIIGLSIPGLLGGSVIFESIFSLPGMGRLFFDSVFARDYPVIMGILVIGAGLTLIGNMLADAAYGLADPRVRAR